MARITLVLASDGNNAELAKLVEEHAVNMGHEVTHVSLNACDFPVYTVKREKETDVLPGLQALKDTLSNSDAWFVFAPEYNGSYPPVLNNAIAWLSRRAMIFDVCSVTERWPLEHILAAVDSMSSWRCACNFHSLDATLWAVHW